MNGNETVNHAKPGPYADPSEKKMATVNVFSGEDGSIKAIDGTFHTHPKGTLGPGSNTLGGQTASFVQTPSDVDINSAKSNAQSGAVRGNSYVLGTGNGTVYIYNGTGVVATFPLRKFTTIGISK